MLQTKEEILKKAKWALRERYAKIKSLPEKYSQKKEGTAGVLEKKRK